MGLDLDPSKHVLGLQGMAAGVQLPNAPRLLGRDGAQTSLTVQPPCANGTVKASDLFDL